MPPKTIRGRLTDLLVIRTGFSRQAVIQALARGGPRMPVYERIWEQEFPRALADLGLTEVPARGVVSLDPQGVAR